MSDSIERHFRELVHRRREPCGGTSSVAGGRDGVVLFGAGTIGREFLAALQTSGVPVFAFADNTPAKWGTVVADVPVMRPADCIRRFQGRAIFIVTIGRVGAAAAQIVDEVRARGADPVLHFVDAIAQIPQVWPNFFLSPDAFSEEQGEACAAAYARLADEESRRHFWGHLTWRATLDPSGLATPTYDDQYFPSDIIVPTHCRDFIDIGAFTGDTLAALMTFAGPRLREYQGFEPDASSYAQLASAAERARGAGILIHVHHLALGGAAGESGFSGGGVTTSQIDPSSAAHVRCARLDDLQIPSATYVKIDVEGSEGEVLAGANDTLCQFKPTIAIATYHRPADLFELPLRIAPYASDYSFYLRSHGDAGIDLVCYAVRDAAR